MSASTGTGMLSAFAVRSFRFQFFADLCTAWAIEMEVLILAWYVLVETDSAFMVALIGVARFAGTVVTPFIGALADRLPRKPMLIAVRAVFAALAVALASLALTGAMLPWHAFVVATLSGLFRPADMMLRQSLIGDTVPRESLMNAMGFARTTLDSARIFGALAGASLMATLGLGGAYVFVALFYVASAGLSIGIAVVGQARPERLASPMADLRAGVAYVARSARIHVLLWIAFLVNLAGLCVTGGLLPVVARDVYGMDELGLGMLVATFAAGALVGSLGIATVLRRLSADPVILYSLVIWHLVLFGFAFIETPTWGIPVLGLIGLLSSLVMVPLASALIFATDVEYRARVLGLRQLAVVGLPIGLLITGTLVDVYSVAVALASVALAGVGAGVWLLLRWAHLVGAQSERS